MLPEDIDISDRVYETKKILYSMRMDYERIFTCPNDCILYQNEYKTLEECPVSERSQYITNKKSPAKVL